MNEVSRRRKEGHSFAERLSQVLAGEIPGVEENIRYSYFDDSFRLWWGERGDPDKSALITFDQLRTLNDEELKQVIRSSVLG
ncbi:MAG: hypothetical protein V3V62_07520 [bacterium]